MPYPIHTLPCPEIEVAAQNTDAARAIALSFRHEQPWVIRTCVHTSVRTCEGAHD